MITVRPTDRLFFAVRPDAETVEAACFVRLDIHAGGFWVAATVGSVGVEAVFVSGLIASLASVQPGGQEYVDTSGNAVKARVRCVTGPR